MTTRYGQLSYTSFDSVGSAGGWQVKETTGGITAEEVDLLVSGIHTTLDPVEPLPRYPTAEQLAAIPRRLVYRRINKNTAAYWHTVPAGFDNTGRPGNIFAHTLLDRDASRSTAAPRPIELWRSPLWLTPHGGPAVTAAALPNEVPRAGGVVTADSVIEFACDTATWRLNTLCALLDAVAAALDGGLTVLLGVGSVDAAALWIGAVSFLMSPGTARRLNFSTFDRASDLEYSLRTGQHLVAVPRVDLVDVPSGVLVIDEAETVSLGELHGQQHRTAGGHTIAATAWSAMAQVVLVDPASAAQAIADINEFASRIADVDLPPALPMAISVLNRRQWEDAAPEARSVIAAHATRACAADPVVARIVDGEVRRLVGTTTAEAWRATETAGGLVGDAARAVYISRAIHDDRWLEQPGPLPALTRRFAPGMVPDTLTAETAAALTAAACSGDLERLLRMIDLLNSSGCEDGVRRIIEQRVVPALLDDVQGPSLVTRLRGRVSRDTRLLVAAAVLPALERRNCHRLGQPVLGWLAEDVCAPGAEQLARACPGDSIWTAAALRGLSALDSEAPLPPDRYLALWWLRMHDTPFSECEFLLNSGLWDPAELLVAVGDGPLPARPVAVTLVGAPDSADLRRLADRVVTANTDDTAVACAAVWVVEPSEWITTGYLRTHYRGYTPYWNALITEIGAAAVHRDFTCRLLVLVTLATVTGAPEPECMALLADAGLAAEVSYRVETLVTSGVVDADTLIAAALLSSDTPARASGAGLLRSVAVRLAASRGSADVQRVVERMAQLGGAASESDLRRHRRVALKVLPEWCAEAVGVGGMRTHGSG